VSSFRGKIEAKSKVLNLLLRDPSETLIRDEVEELKQEENPRKCSPDQPRNLLLPPSDHVSNHVESKRPVTSNID
jgi:hypothetical protein